MVGSSLKIGTVVLVFVVLIPSVSALAGCKCSDCSWCLTCGSIPQFCPTTSCYDFCTTNPVVCNSCNYVPFGKRSISSKFLEYLEEKNKKI
uniref:Uncharacterized protein n=1 Tax=Acrobeloides nanus TaxID=290746 RepID=A0A914E092_9BILA